MTQPLVFIDTETTGLDPALRLPWEIAMLRVDDDGESMIQFYVDVPLERADPKALQIGGFYDRHPAYTGEYKSRLLTMADAAARVEVVTRGATLVGAVPSFDAWTLDPFLRAHHLLPAWHYQPVDIETLIAGYILGSRDMHHAHSSSTTLDLSDDFVVPPLPWDSEDLSRAVGVNPADYDRHTAEGDVYWCKAMWDAIGMNANGVA